MKQIAGLKKKINTKGLIRAPGKSDIFNAFLTMICQMASVFGAFPFGCVCFSSIIAGVDAWYLFLPAIIIGAVWAGAPVFKYVFTSLIIWTAKSIIPKKDINYFTGPVICAFAVFVGGLYNAFLDYSLGYGILILCGEAILSAAVYPVFANFNELKTKVIKNEPVSKESAASFAILLTVILWGLNSIYLPFSISLKHIVVIYLILCITMYSTSSVSAAFALLLGYVSILYPPQALSAAGMLAICAALAGFFKSFGQLGAAVGFLTGVTAIVVWAGNIEVLSISLIDIFISTAIFAIIPLKFHQRTGIFLANTFRPSMQRRDFRIKEYIIEELNCFSNTLLEFSKQFKNSFQRGTENKNTEDEIFDETAARICVSCNKNKECWQKNYTDTYKYMYSILETTQKSGYCDIHNAPIVFTQRCIEPELFLNEFNHVYEMRKEALLRNGVRSVDRNFVSNQYNEISKIINELSEEIKSSFFFDEQKEHKIMSECTSAGIYIRDINVIKNKDGYYEMFFAPGAQNEKQEIQKIATEVLNMKMKEVYCKNNSLVRLCADNIYETKVTVLQKNKEDESVSGDTVIHFETDKNKYYVILCDGMGSGEDASKESRMTAELLAGFLRAGFSKTTALSLINSTLALKMEREGFSTIDLCEIDLRSGIVEFIKIGGAQSYIKQNDKLETITSKSLPAGILEDIKTENISRKLEDNDMIVMVSDGISEAGYGMMRGEWIKKLMRTQTQNPNELCENIINNARKKIYPRTPDDMSAVVISIHKLENNELLQEEVI